MLYLSHNNYVEFLLATLHRISPGSMSLLCLISLPPSLPQALWGQRWRRLQDILRPWFCWWCLQGHSVSSAWSSGWSSIWRLPQGVKNCPLNISKLKFDYCSIEGSEILSPKWCVYLYISFSRIQPKLFVPLCLAWTKRTKSVIVSVSLQTTLLWPALTFNQWNLWTSVLGMPSKSPSSWP